MLSLGSHRATMEPYTHTVLTSQEGEDKADRLLYNIPLLLFSC